MCGVLVFIFLSFFLILIVPSIFSSPRFGFACGPCLMKDRQVHGDALTGSAAMNKYDYAVGFARYHQTRPNAAGNRGLRSQAAGHLRGACVYCQESMYACVLVRLCKWTAGLPTKDRPHEHCVQGPLLDLLVHGSHHGTKAGADRTEVGRSRPILSQRELAVANLHPPGDIPNYCPLPVPQPDHCIHPRGKWYQSIAISTGVCGTTLHSIAPKKPGAYIDDTFERQYGLDAYPLEVVVPRREIGCGPDRLARHYEQQVEQEAQLPLRCDHVVGCEKRVGKCLFGRDTLGRVKLEHTL